MNNSEEAIFCLAVNTKFTCSWLNFPSYWRGTKADNPKIAYICVWNTFWHFLWNKCDQCSRNSQYFIQKTQATSVRPDYPEAKKILPVQFLPHTVHMVYSPEDSSGSKRKLFNGIRRNQKGIGICDVCVLIFDSSASNVVVSYYFHTYKDILFMSIKELIKQNRLWYL